MRIKVFFVQLLYFPLWLLDYLEVSFFGFFRYLTYVIVLFVSLQLVTSGSFINTKYHGFLNDLTYLNDGIIASMYPQKSSDAGNVLGVVTKRQLPRLVDDMAVPTLTAKAALVIDITNNKTLYKLNDTERLAPASTTKLMTALVSFDLYSVDDVVSVPDYCTAIESTKAGFTSGEKLSVKDLLNALLIASAGDSACVLATAKVNYDTFVQKMNEKADKIGMKETNFSNPIGLDGVSGEHYSTAHDLSLLARYAIKNKQIAEIVKTKEYILSGSGDTTPLKLENTNKLLWDIPQTVGIKTGRTAEAGEVLIYEYKDVLAKQDLMIIVMGSQNRFEDTKALLGWTLRSYSWD